MRKQRAQQPADNGKPAASEAAPSPEKLLDQIASAATQCRELEELFGRNAPPELETLIKVLRVLILKMSLDAANTPELCGRIRDLMKLVLDWARLQEERKKRELAERKYQDQAEAQKAARAREEREQSGGGLAPSTLEKIERELKLF